MDRTGYFSQKIASIMSNFSFREASIAIESILVSSVSDPDPYFLAGSASGNVDLDPGFI